jgi:prevent-host-death family protein
VDVPISELRANLRTWVMRAKGGDDVVVTERGVPVARLTPVEAASVIERLERDGVLSRATQANRPQARGRRRVRAAAPVSDLVSELRR